MNAARLAVVLVLCLAAPPVAAESVREKHLRWAEHFLLPGEQHTATTTHFAVTTDSPHENVAENVAQNLEATFAVISKTLAPAQQPLVMKSRVAVFAYRSSDSFDGFKQQVGTPSTLDGIYMSSGVLAFALDAEAVEPLVGTMIHEATHAYLAELCRPGGIRMPLWLNEGFATYVGNSELRKGELILGSRTESTTYHGRGWTYGGRSSAKIGGKVVRSAMRKKKALTVSDLMRADAASFYGERADLYYSQAWILVHFLIHGQPGWDTQRFPALIQQVVEGQPVEDAVRIVYGLSKQDLSTAYFDYVNSF